MSKRLILASGSAIRRAVLEAAGLTVEAISPPLDEEAEKGRLRAAGATIPDQALGLAHAKALSISSQHDGYVIGADQMLALGEQAFDKPRDMGEARKNLQALRGKTHELVGGICVAKGANILWSHVSRPQLTMWSFSDAFLDEYLKRAGPAVLSSVGAYQLENLGAQLFSSVEGDYFSVLGLPLFPLLAFLREHGVIAS